MPRLLILAVIALFPLSSPAFSTAIHVPADQPTIQADIDAVSANDAVPVAGGMNTGTVAGVNSPSDHPDDMYWNNEISSYWRINGTVRCMTVYEGRLILGGAFTSTGILTTNRVVSWDGESFSPLGSGTDSTVVALTEYDGKLIAAGLFDSADGEPASHVAAWDGSSWSALGDGLSGKVTSLTVINSTLVAGGAFTISGSSEIYSVAKWNGTSWSGLGDNLDGTVNALAVYENKLYAGGSFVIDADTLKQNLAYWDSNEWHAVVDSLHDAVSAMIVFEDRLIVAGYSVICWWGGCYYRTLVASWDGLNWVDTRGGLDGFYCTSLAVHDNELLAAGWFYGQCIEGGDANRYSLLRWDGTTWNSQIDGLIFQEIRALIDYDGDFIAAGAFRSIDGILAWRAAVLNDSGWAQLGGAEYRGYNLTTFDDRLITAGPVTGATRDTEADFGLMAWDGTSWSNYGPSINVFYGCDWICIGCCPELCVLTDNSVPGNFSFGVYGDRLFFSNQAGPYYNWANGVYAWDHVSLNHFLDYYSSDGALAAAWATTMITYHDKLIAAGLVRSGDYYGIVQYDGTAWSDMGISRPDYGQFTWWGWIRNPVLVVFDDKLILNGSPDTDHKLQVWDGSTWSLWGTGEKASIDSVLAMTTYMGTLVAGGFFSTAGLTPASNIAFWDGEAWQPLGDGLNGSVRTLTIYDGKLIAGGSFTEAGGQPADHIAAWDGAQWYPLGSGVNGLVRQLLTFHDDLIVSGQFSTAGGQPSPFISVWSKKDRMKVALDVKPGSCHNPINGNSAHGKGKAVLPVAIMGSTDFDVHDIDLTTVTLNGASPVRWNYEDVGTPPDDPDVECACSEAGTDGYDDLTMKFYSAEIVASLANSNIVHVQGQLYDGSAFEGQDCVTLVGNGDGKAADAHNEERELELMGNSPNPFNPVTQVRFYLPDAMHVTIDIYNVLGQRIERLEDDDMEAGEHAVIWDGSGAASGVYFYRFVAGDYVESRKMLLLK